MYIIFTYIMYYCVCVRVCVCVCVCVCARARVCVCVWTAQTLHQSRFVGASPVMTSGFSPIPIVSVLGVEIQLKSLHRTFYIAAPTLLKFTGRFRRISRCIECLHGVSVDRFHGHKPLTLTTEFAERHGFLQLSAKDCEG